MYVGAAPGTPASETSTPPCRYPKIARPDGTACPAEALTWADPVCIDDEPAVMRLRPPTGRDTGAAVIGDDDTLVAGAGVDVDVELVELVEEPVVVIGVVVDPLAALKVARTIDQFVEEPRVTAPLTGCVELRRVVSPAARDVPVSC